MGYETWARGVVKKGEEGTRTRERGCKSRNQAKKRGRKRAQEWVARLERRKRQKEKRRDQTIRERVVRSENINQVEKADDKGEK